MAKKDLSIQLLVDGTPEETFRAISNVRGWWSQLVEGRTEQAGDEFRYRHKDLHDSTQRVVESVPGKRIVWLVTESDLSFLNHRSEWTGTKIIFDLLPSGHQTEIRFTHEGLLPESECIDACTKGWTYYLEQSLVPLVNSGEGRPDK